jgi:hypothetical protein
MGPTSPQPSDSRLLKLPPELRNQTYEFALYNDGKGLQYCDKAYGTLGGPTMITPNPSMPPELGCSMRPSFNQLQYVSRQLRKEKRRLEVRLNHFIITPALEQHMPVHASCRLASLLQRMWRVLYAGRRWVLHAGRRWVLHAGGRRVLHA